MKVIGYYADNEQYLVESELPKPKAEGRDILVAVKAIAVNPIDIKIRKNTQPEADKIKVLGWDAAGIVIETGSEVSLFQPGDEVWYAGDMSRPGANSEFHLVDERIVAKKPKSLNFQEAAALPLTSLTAWELLFDRLKISPEQHGTLLIVGAAGGVGSILVQLASQLTKLTVIGTASRAESIKWVLNNGAHYVIDHNKEMKTQLEALNCSELDYVISLTHSDQYATQLVDLLKPQGQFALIDNPQNIDIKLFKLKSISIHWEMMFTRSFFKTVDMIRQHEILTEIAQMVDKGQIKTTVSEYMGLINAANLTKAHALIESGSARGKIVLSEFKTNT